MQYHPLLLDAKERLARRGILMREEWIHMALCHAEERENNIASNVEALATFLTDQALNADFNTCAAGSKLPADMSTMCNVAIPGTFVLQVDESVDVSHPSHESEELGENGGFADALLDDDSTLAKNRDGSSRKKHPKTLKLNMTDGVHRFFASELVHVPALHEAYLQSGFKLELKNPIVSYGLILLTPKTCSVLGGSVEYLDKLSSVHRPRSGSRGPDQKRSSASSSGSAVPSASHQHAGAETDRSHVDRRAAPVARVAPASPAIALSFGDIKRGEMKILRACLAGSIPLPPDSGFTCRWYFSDGICRELQEAFFSDSLMEKIIGCPLRDIQNGRTPLSTAEEKLRRAVVHFHGYFLFRRDPSDSLTVMDTVDSFPSSQHDAVLAKVYLSKLRST
eukprot:ANDGO_04489.mRNA.1 RecQ-mediated genome instability protein 1